MNKLVFLAGLMTITSVIAGVASAHAAEDYSPVKYPCTEKEEWVLPKQLTEVWAEKFKATIQDRNKAASQVLFAIYLHQNATNPEIKHFAHYWIGRIFYKLKVKHLAHKVFSALLVDTSNESLNARMAALGCMNEIRRTLPSLVDTTESLKNFPLAKFPIYQNILKEAAIHSIKAKTSGTFANNDLSQEARFFLGDKTLDFYLKTLLLASKEDDLEIAKLYPAFKAIKDFSKIPEPDLPLIHLSLARGLYGAGHLKDAIEVYNKVSNTSNFINLALSERGWAFLLLEKYPEAIGTASNLIVGGLKKTFSPDGYSVAVIALNETCNFVEAMELIKAFRKAYGATYKWLYDWQSGGANKNNLYSTLSGFLKKKTKLPEKIGLEWIRSPIFIALQEELNLILDEKNTLPKLWKVMLAPSQGKEKAKLKNATAYLQNLVIPFNKEIPKKETQTVSLINEHLYKKNKQLLAGLAEVSENLQRVEVEALSELGEKMITDNALGPDPRSSGKPIQRAEEGPVWDWGKFNTKSEDDAEVWEDELGFLRADLKTRCKQK